MRYTILLIAVCYTLNVSAQLDFLGFDRDHCLPAINNQYTFSNYSYGGTSSSNLGYYVYRNGVEVFSEGGSMNQSMVCKEIAFVNDSTGFLVKKQLSGGTHFVMYTVDYGETWTSIGFGAPDYLGIYVLNANTSYLVTKWMNTLYIDKVSTFSSNLETLPITDETPLSGISIFDSEVTEDFCGQDSLIISILSDSDTIQYQINWTLNNVGIRSDQSRIMSAFTIFPNPASEYFQLSNIPVDINSVSLLSMNGLIIKSYDRESISRNIYQIDKPSAGTYIVRIDTTSGALFYTRLTILN
jgi:hypothetical protein